MNDEEEAAKYQILIGSSGPLRTSPKRLDAILRPSTKRHGAYPTCVRIPLIQGGKPLPPRAEDFTWITKEEYQVRVVEAAVNEILEERELTR